MTRERSPKDYIACQSFSMINKEIIKAYKAASNRDRDMMWMRYRDLRKLFDDELNNFTASPVGMTLV